MPHSTAQRTFIHFSSVWPFWALNLFLFFSADATIIVAMIFQRRSFDFVRWCIWTHMFLTVLQKRHSVRHQAATFIELILMYHCAIAPIEFANESLNIFAIIHSEFEIEWQKITLSTVIWLTSVNSTNLNAIQSPRTISFLFAFAYSCAS